MQSSTPDNLQNDSMSRKVATDEYTPEQRRIVNARLDEAEKGPFYGPFSAKEGTAFLKESLKAARPAKPKRSK
jgi:hypothetical protein